MERFIRKINIVFVFVRIVKNNDNKKGESKKWIEKIHLNIKNSMIFLLFLFGIKYFPSS